MKNISASQLTEICLVLQSQYIFIFYALLEATTFGNTETASHDLRMKVQKLAAKNTRTHKSNLESEFEVSIYSSYSPHLKLTTND